MFSDFKGWKENISGINSFAKLPEKCQTYIKALQELVNTKIGIVSTGPDREDTIVMD